MTEKYETEVGSSDETVASKSLKRRTVLASTAGLAAAAVGFGAFGGTAAAWSRFHVDFKGCSEVWMIVGDSDVDYHPPTVAHVIVGTAGGETDCRVVEFTEDRATTIPGQYGDAPVVKYTAGDDEKVLAVLLYNYISGATGGDRFAKPSCMLVNDHRCAQTPNTPDLYEADCVQAAYDGHWEGTYWEGGRCDARIVDGNGASGGNDGGNGPPSGTPGRGHK